MSINALSCVIIISASGIKDTRSIAPIGALCLSNHLTIRDISNRLITFYLGMEKTFKLAEEFKVKLGQTAARMDMGTEEEPNMAGIISNMEQMIGWSKRVAHYVRNLEKRVAQLEAKKS
jgi:hypothetical protein